MQFLRGNLYKIMFLKTKMNLIQRRLSELVRDCSTQFNIGSLLAGYITFYYMKLTNF